MKKFVCLSLLALGMFIVPACSSGYGTPGEAAKIYAGYILKGDFDKYVDACDFGEGLSVEEILAGKNALVEVLKAIKEQVDEKKGGYKSVGVVSEALTEDGKAAKVTLKYTLGNGDSDEDILNLVLFDGVWKVKINN